MTDRPAVSVVIPCFERPEELRRALASVVAQTVGDFEVVVGDDGSTADLPAVAASFGDPRLRVVRRETNGGIGAARNTAIRAAAGQWVSFLDSDDEWMPDHLERQLASARALPDDVAGVTTGFVMRYPSGREDVRRPGQHGDLLSRIVRGVDLSVGSTMLVRATVFDTVGLWAEDIRRNEDYDWLLRLGEAGLDLVVLPDITVVIHSDDHAPLDVELSKRCARLTIERHAAALRERDPALLRHLRAKLHEEVAWAAWRSRRWATFGQHVTLAVVSDPAARATKLGRSAIKRLKARRRAGSRAANGSRHGPGQQPSHDRPRST